MVDNAIDAWFRQSISPHRQHPVIADEIGARHAIGDAHLNDHVLAECPRKRLGLPYQLRLLARITLHPAQRFDDKGQPARIGNLAPKNP